MKYLILVVALLGFSACGKNTAVHMPDEVQAYYYEYFQLVGSDKEMGGTIAFEVPAKSSFHPEAHSIGDCGYNLDGSYKIRLDPEYWNSASDDMKRNVVFHELTHCVFHSPVHSDDERSYMYWQAPVKTKEVLDEQVVSYTSTL